MLMKNFNFNLQNHAEEITTTDITSTVTSADAAVTIAATATSTSNVITAVVATVAADAHTGIAEKIAHLAAEIKTTKSLFVKIRNTVEIGTLSVLLTKAASAVSSKLDQ
jgi:hypothetical protein